MNSTKCKSCGLSNFASDLECRRCGQILFEAHVRQKEKPPVRHTVSSLLIFAALAGGGYYIYSSMQQSIADVNAAEANRVGTQAPQNPQPAGLTRNEADRQHARRVGGALQDNPSLEAQRKHNDETQKIIEQASNSSQP